MMFVMKGEAKSSGKCKARYRKPCLRVRMMEANRNWGRMSRSQTRREKRRDRVTMRLRTQKTPQFLG